MLRPPRFWTNEGGKAANTLFPLLLSPASSIVVKLAAKRVARPGFAAPVPVLCCGNLTLGGAGKTTLAIDLAERLAGRGMQVHVLARGYGGAARGPLRVEPRHSASMVGDEALLLAAVAPTWIGADRAASARAAIAAGAEVLVLDDGLQNPTLQKSFSFLVIDGTSGFGNGRVFPAGPLREPIASGFARAHAAVLIGVDRAGVSALIPRDLPLLRARLVPAREEMWLRGARVFAFAGIARPEKFFASLEEAGAVVVRSRSFPDHHSYSGPELSRLLGMAARLDALAVTTAKDRARLPAAMRERVHVLAITLAWDDPGALESLLAPHLPFASVR